MNKGKTIFFILLFSNITWALIVTSVDSDTANFSEKDGIKRYDNVVPDHEMGYLVETYEVLAGKTISFSGVNEFYEGIYFLKGSAISKIDNQELQIKKGSFLGLGLYTQHTILVKEDLVFVRIKSPAKEAINEYGVKTGVVVHTSLERTIGSETDVQWGNGNSRRFLLEHHGLGFSIMDTTIGAGTVSDLQYKHHLETCVAIGGSGEVVKGGVAYPISSGLSYILNQHDQHILKGGPNGLNLISVFSPALVGDEKHTLGTNGSSSYRSPSKEKRLCSKFYLSGG